MHDLHGALPSFPEAHSELACLSLSCGHSSEPLQVFRGRQAHHRLQGLFELVEREVGYFPHHLAHAEPLGVLHHHFGPQVQGQFVCFVKLLSLALVDIDFDYHGKSVQAA